MTSIYESRKAKIQVKSLILGIPDGTLPSLGHGVHEAPVCRGAEAVSKKRGGGEGCDQRWCALSQTFLSVLGAPLHVYGNLTQISIPGDVIQSLRRVDVGLFDFGKRNCCQKTGCWLSIAMGVISLAGELRHSHLAVHLAGFHLLYRGGSFSAEALL